MEKDREELLLTLVRLQSKLISLYQTWVAKTTVFLAVHGVIPEEDLCKNIKKMREDIEKIKFKN